MEYTETCPCCSYEINEGETLYEWEDEEWICSDCFKGKIDEMSLDEIAELMQCRTKTIVNPRPWSWYSPEDHAEEEERLIND